MRAIITKAPWLLARGAPGTEGPWRPLTDLEVAHWQSEVARAGCFSSSPNSGKEHPRPDARKGHHRKGDPASIRDPRGLQWGPGPRHKHSHPPLNLNNSIALPENGTLKRGTLTHLYEKVVARLHVFFKTSCAVRERTHLPPKVSQTNR